MKLKPLNLLAYILVSLSLYLSLTASSTGNGGAMSGCSCHGTQNTGTTVTITPTLSGYAANQEIDFTITVNNATRAGAGFSLLPSTGSIISLGSGVKFFNPSTITHTNPKAATGGSTSWTFRWKAPASPSGSLNFSVAGNAVNLNGNATGDAWRFGAIASVPLPVEFLSFEVNQKDDFAILNWEIGSAVNASHFEIEKSYDGSYFMTIGKAKLSSESKYTYQDNKLRNGIHYYRLKEVDFDGQITYSDVKSIKIENIETIDLIPTLVEKNEVRLIGLNELENVEFIAFSLDGRPMKKQVGSEHLFDIEGLPLGTYFITATNNKKILLTKKIFKI